MELLLRDDLDPAALSLLGDALGPDSWLDVLRQGVSTYAWDAFADLDPFIEFALHLDRGFFHARGAHFD